MRARVRVDEPDVRPPAQAAQQAEGVAAERHRVLLQHEVVALRQRVRDLLDERGLVGAVRDDALDLVVVGDVEREVDERPDRVELVVERPRGPRAHPLGGVLVQQPPGAEVVVVAVVAQLALDVPGEDLRAAGLDRDAAVLADRLRRLRERRAERLDLAALLRGQLAQLLGRRDRRVRACRRRRRSGFGKIVYRMKSTGIAARVRDQVRGDADRLVPDLGHATSGSVSSKTRSSARKWSTVRPHAPLLRLALARPVVAVDVAEVRDRVGLLDPPHLVVEVDRRGELGDTSSSAARVDAVRPQLAARRARDRSGATTVVPARARARARRRRRTRSRRSAGVVNRNRIGPPS